MFKQPNNPPQLTVADAEAVTGLAVQLIGPLAKAVRHGQMPWLRAIAAAAVACRGVAATAMAKDPALTLDEARQMMLVEFVKVLSMPGELVRILPGDDPDDDLEAIALPVKRH
jgi:hypothetical protein